MINCDHFQIIASQWDFCEKNKIIFNQSKQQQKWNEMSTKLMLFI